MKHVMLDLETWGLTPGSAIASIGAVMFDPETGELGARFYAVIDRASCEQVGLTVNAATLEWWSDQTPEARSALEGGDSITAVLSRFARWLTVCGADRLWANDPNFDETLLAAAYRACGIDVPWHYRSPRSVRTIMDLAGREVDRAKGTLHNALDDAVNQAEAVCAAYRKLGLAREADIRKEHERVLAAVRDLRDRWDMDLSAGEASDVGADWCAAAERRVDQVGAAIAALDFLGAPTPADRVPVVPLEMRQ